MNGLMDVFKNEIHFGFELFSKAFSNTQPQPPIESEYRITENNIQRADESDSDRVTEDD